eukprot:410193_1
MTSWYFLHVFWLISVESYYVSLNTFEFQVAETYCVEHCGSHLASIHNINDYNQLTNTIQNITSANAINLNAESTFIGLNDITTNNNYVWTDNSPVDYIIPNIGGYPYANSEPNGLGQCIAIDSTDNLLYDKSNTETNTMFACNHCNGVLTKYVILDDAADQYKIYTSQKTACEDTFGTTLASLHSTTDVSDTYRLAITSMSQQTQGTGNGQGCWIGLYDNNIVNNIHYNYSFTDGTTFDFGNDLSGSVYPWSANNNEPDGGISGYCTQMRKAANFEWADTTCDQTRKAICNYPSEICYATQWTVIDGIIGDWKLKPCQLILSFQNRNRIIIGNKRWYNGDKALVIEYMFTINNFDNSSSGGVILHQNIICDTYYYIGINPVDATVFVTVQNETYMNLNIINEPLQFVYQVGTFYLLRIEILNGFIFVYVNNNMLINNQQIGLIDNGDGMSPYIGINNIKSDIIAKSLFISGSVIYESNTEIMILSWFESCTSQPTMLPTVLPTIVPTVLPTIVPTTHPSTNPTIIPTFNPTKTPTHRPTLVLLPTIKPKENEYIPITTDSKINAIDQTSVIKDSDNSFYIILIIFICLICVCSFCLIFFMYQKMKKQKQSQSDIININHNISNEYGKEIKLSVIQNKPMDTLNNSNIEQNSSHVIGELNREANDDDNTDYITPNGNRTDELIIGDDENETPDGTDDNTTDEGDYANTNNCNEVDDEDIQRKYSTPQYDELLRVKQWLQNVVKLPQYYDNFAGNGYESLQIIHAISNVSELAEIDIVLKEHQKQIMDKIQKWNENNI